MKKSLCLAASLLALNLTPVFGQPNGMPPSGPNFAQLRNTIVLQANGSPQNEPPALTKFNLDFPGGTPKELVAAIEKAMGKPLNAIIPTEDADVQMPPLKLNEVTFPQLSDTLKIGSFKPEYVLLREKRPGFPSPYDSVETGYYFRTTDDRPTDNSVWFFYVKKVPVTPPTEKICRFFPLAYYLNRGFTVDDITTAVQTGWKMSGETATPELSYHKETKMLIAFGEPAKLNTIQNVLESLPFSPITQKQFDSMQNDIGQLQKQIDQLTKKISTPLPTATVEEKSGK